MIIFVAIFILVSISLKAETPKDLTDKLNNLESQVSVATSKVTETGKEKDRIESPYLQSVVIHQRAIITQQQALIVLADEIRKYEREMCKVGEQLAKVDKEWKCTGTYNKTGVDKKDTSKDTKDTTQ